MNRNYKGESFACVYREALLDLYNNSDFTVSPRGLCVKESFNVSMTFSPLSFMFLNHKKGSNKKYINGELEWYFRGLKDVAFISKFSSFWNKICNADGSCNSAYGNLIFKSKNIHGFSQYMWALKQIKHDKFTRQSILFFNKEDFQYIGNKDFVCTSYVIFFIRDDKLYMNVHMRSNDAVLGTINDVAFFSMLFQQFRRHLLKYYPSLEVGLYTHIVDSFHLYEDKYDVVGDMLECDFTSVEYVLNYDIIDESGNFLKFDSL